MFSTDPRTRVAGMQKQSSRDLNNSNMWTWKVTSALGSPRYLQAERLDDFIYSVLKWYDLGEMRMWLGINLVVLVWMWGPLVSFAFQPITQSASNSCFQSLTKFHLAIYETWHSHDSEYSYCDFLGAWVTEDVGRIFNRNIITHLQTTRCILLSQKTKIFNVLWRVCPMQELLSHGNLKTRTQQ
jgi:hypothetical protein